MVPDHSNSSLEEIEDVKEVPQIPVTEGSGQAPTIRNPHTCPACEGWGTRTKLHAHVDGVCHVKCPACNGAGIVWGDA